MTNSVFSLYYKYYILHLLILEYHGILHTILCIYKSHDLLLNTNCILIMVSKPELLWPITRITCRG